MANVRFQRQYRTYRYIDKNPIIDKVRTLVQDEGLYTRLNIVSTLSGVSRGAIDGWFHGETKNPQHHTVAAVVTALGYEETFQRTKSIELDKELEVAKRWLDKQKDLQEKFKQPKKKKLNGNTTRTGK
jgi:hypothetical protein